LPLRRTLLLRQLGIRQLNWSLASRRQEVMKAVMLNSADKVQDTGNGLRLGMKRRIDKQNQDWLAYAYRDPKSLHAQMGTGQLNAFRASHQCGSVEPGCCCATYGLGLSHGECATIEYVSATFTSSFAALTLVWNRSVELNDTNKMVSMIWGKLQSRLE